MIVTKKIKISRKFIRVYKNYKKIIGSVNWNRIARTVFMYAEIKGNPCNKLIHIGCVVMLFCN